MSLSLRPITIKQAFAWNERVHRRLPQIQGAMWAIAVERPEVGIVGVAIVGRPPRVLDDGRRLVVQRVAVLAGDASSSGHRGACSILYGSIARAARSMGATDLWTYTHFDERGTSLRAAGWLRDPEPTKGGEHHRVSRSRKSAVDAGPKWRWWAPWSERACFLGWSEAL